MQGGTNHEYGNFSEDEGDGEAGDILDKYFYGTWTI